MQKRVVVFWRFFFSLFLLFSSPRPRRKKRVGPRTFRYYELLLFSQMRPRLLACLTTKEQAERPDVLVVSVRPPDFAAVRPTELPREFLVLFSVRGSTESEDQEE
jgi:hypothetical protein